MKKVTLSLYNGFRIILIIWRIFEIASYLLFSAPFILVSKDGNLVHLKFEHDIFKKLTIPT